VRDNPDLLEPTRADTAYIKVERRLCQRLLSRPQVIDALETIHEMPAGPRRECCLQGAERAISGLLSAGQLDHQARVIHERKAAGLWAPDPAAAPEKRQGRALFTIPVGNGAGGRYGRQERLRRGPIDAVIDSAADVLAARLDADRRRERPEPATDTERQAISEVFAFLGLPLLPRPAPLAQPAGAYPDPDEIALTDRKRARAAKQKARRQTHRDAARGVAPPPTCVHDWQEPCTALKQAIKDTPPERARDPGEPPYWRVAECSRCGYVEIERAGQAPASPQLSRRPGHPSYTVRYECPICGGLHSRSNHPRGESGPERAACG